MLKKIIQNPNPILYKKAEKVVDFKDKNFRKLLKNMEYTLREEDGLGLAAPQVNSSKAVFVISPDYAPRIRTFSIPLSLLSPIRPTVFVNPRIINYGDKKEEWEEGCLSIHGAYYKLTRATEVTLEAMTKNGKKFTIKADGTLAKIFQHETDHLNGILIINKLHEK